MIIIVNVVVVVVVVVVAPCQNHIFSHAVLIYKDFLKILIRYILCERNFQLDPLFLIPVYFRLKCFPSLLDVTGIRVFPRNFRSSNPFPGTCKTSLPARIFSLLIVHAKASIATGTSSRL